MPLAVTVPAPPVSPAQPGGGGIITSGAHSGILQDQAGTDIFDQAGGMLTT
jgi:hypothetical protein